MSLSKTMELNTENVNPLWQLPKVELYSFVNTVLPLAVFWSLIISRTSAAQKNKPICTLNAGGDACHLLEGVTAFIRQKSHESGEGTVTLAAAETVSGYNPTCCAKIMFSSAVGGSWQQREEVRKTMERRENFQSLGCSYANRVRPNHFFG